MIDRLLEMARQLPRVVALAVGLVVLMPEGSAFAQASERLAYDALGRLIRVERPTTTTVYTYDAAGNRSAVSVTPPPPASGPRLPVLVVPSGSGFLVIPLKSTASQS